MMGGCLYYKDRGHSATLDAQAHLLQLHTNPALQNTTSGVDF
jgi:hypothetical protein